MLNVIKEAKNDTVILKNTLGEKINEVTWS